MSKFIFEFEKSELNMFIVGEIMDSKEDAMPRVRGIFYDEDDGLEKGEIGYPMAGHEEFYGTIEDAMREAIPYIFEEWKK